MRKCPCLDGEENTFESLEFRNGSQRLISGENYQALPLGKTCQVTINEPRDRPSSKSTHIGLAAIARVPKEGEIFAAETMTFEISFEAFRFSSTPGSGNDLGNNETGSVNKVSFGELL